VDGVRVAVEKAARPIAWTESHQAKLEGRAILVRNGPHDVNIDSEIMVYENMAHAYDLRPRYLGMLRLQLGRNVASGLAYDLQVVHDPSLNQLILFKGCSGRAPYTCQFVRGLP
jgi:hypothetical protein